MPRFIYRTATTLTGHIADENDSLSWLFAVEHEDADDEHDGFMDTIGVIVEGSTTYEWILREERLLTEPAKWQEYFGDRPTFVFTSRSLPVPDGAAVAFRQGAVADHLPEIRAAAGDLAVWVAGGGDLVGQFFEAGALDEIALSIAPVTLAAGAPLLPRRIESDRLTLQSARQQGQFVNLVLTVESASVRAAGG